MTATWAKSSMENRVYFTWAYGVGSVRHLRKVLYGVESLRQSPGRGPLWSRCRGAVVDWSSRLLGSHSESLQCRPSPAHHTFTYLILSRLHLQSERQWQEDGSSDAKELITGRRLPLTILYQRPSDCYYLTQYIPQTKGTYRSPMIHRRKRPTGVQRSYAYDTIRYGRFTCTQKLTRWPA